MKKIVILLSVLCMGLSACSSPASPQQPTATQPPPTPLPTDPPVPSSTPAPTATLRPTSTPTPKPTATSTPDKAATQSAKATQSAEADIARVQEDLKGAGLDLPAGRVGWMQDFPYSIEMSDYNSYYWAPLDESLKAKDFILKSDITWKSTGGLVTCGFFFRSEANFEEGKQYLFSMQRLSGLPDWRIAYLRYGRFQRNITGWRTASAINQDQGATNELILQVIGGEYTLYINGQRIGTFPDYSVKKDEGYLAYYGYQESGESNCSFDNSWIWLVEAEQ